MTTLTIAGTLTAADTDTREVSGLLLPYGEPGRTSEGTVTAEQGSVTIPDDPGTVLLNLGHDRDRPIGRATAILDTPEGLRATFRVARTLGGDTLLAEASEGLRRGLSVELDGITIRAGKLLAGLLTEVGAVVRPAFPSAMLTAADAGDLPDPDQAPDEAPAGPVAPVPATPTPAPVPDPAAAPTEGDEDEDEDEDDPKTPAPPTQGEPTMPGTAAAPSDLRASATRGRGATLTPSDAFGLIAQAFNRQDQAALTAALSDVTIGATTTGIQARTTQPSWLGELWSGKAYQRRYVPLTSTGVLNGMKVAGWRWVDKPVMAPYAGNKAAVPSNTVTVEPADAVASRLAGGWDIDRAFFDFGNSEFIESFFRALTESYARLSDGVAATAIVAAATANPTTAGTVPTGVSAGMAAIVDGALAILDEALPSYAIVGASLYRSVLLTRSDDSLTYLSASLGLEDGTLAGFKIIPAPASVLDVNSVIVGAREAVTFYELGSTPIRVEAENIANGGRDVGVFGYTSSIVNDADAITLVDTAPA